MPVPVLLVLVVLLARLLKLVSVVLHLFFAVNLSRSVLTLSVVARARIGNRHRHCRTTSTAVGVPVALRHFDFNVEQPARLERRQRLSLPMR